MDEPFDVLIPGAGTGQHAIGSALAYRPKAKVLAIDLSRRSLAYAKRMADRYEARDLDFAQADILDLGALDRRFDIIESVGVLHHMAEPFTGWRALIDKLKPGGLMLIGLYSAISRKGLGELREDPAFPGPGCSDDAARAFRQALMARAPGEPGHELLISEDFYALHAFRDLVLHESEAQMTLPEIAAFLKENALTFRGFALPPEQWQAFAERFPDDPPPGSLDNWWAYEQDNPRLFDGMYVFWCEKAG
jgi:SAM-dependent methyltransferase